MHVVRGLLTTAPNDPEARHPMQPVQWTARFSSVVGIRIFYELGETENLKEPRRFSKGDILRSIHKLKEHILTRSTRTCFHRNSQSLRRTRCLRSMESCISSYCFLRARSIPRASKHLPSLPHPTTTEHSYCTLFFWSSQLFRSSRFPNLFAPLYLSPIHNEKFKEKQPLTTPPHSMIIICMYVPTKHNATQQNSTKNTQSNNQIIQHHHNTLTRLLSRWTPQEMNRKKT